MVKREILTSHKQACRRSLLKTKHALLRTIHHSFHGNLLLWRDGSNLVHCSHGWKNLSLGQAPKRPHQEIFKSGLAECEILDYRRKNLSLTETHSVGRKKKILFYLCMIFLLTGLKHMVQAGLEHICHTGPAFSVDICCCCWMLGLLGVRAHFRIRNR